MASSRREYFRRTRKVRMRESSPSVPGWIGLACGLASALLFLIVVILSFRHGGEAQVAVGTIGLIALILAIGGLALGIMGVLEEHVRPIPPRAALVVGAGMSVLLAVLYVYGF
ncbi:MAG: hypothetical protein LIO56_05145 [Lachnospiraceae bacterium]|nr:hypothetical protein [Lachnospiraceae bacterium]